jgi:hypothetical protein
MDQFGISTAMRSMAEVYSTMARQTGRTTQMLDSLKDGDRIVCSTASEKRRLESLCRERDLKVKVLACPPGRHADLLKDGTSQGRTVFDHWWVEQFFAGGLRAMEAELAFLQRELSGYGEAHRQTAREAAKWHPYYPRGEDER